MEISKVGTSTIIFIKMVVGDGAKGNPVRETYKFYLPNGVLIGELNGCQLGESMDNALSASLSASIK